MRTRIAGLFLLAATFAGAALADKPAYPGIWGIWGDPLSREGRPWYKGHVVTAQWEEIEPADNRFDWSSLDLQLTDAASKGLYVMVMVYSGDRSPLWLYEKGVPPVKTTFRGGTTYPFYLDEHFQTYFRRMIERTAAHLDKELPPAVRKKIIAVQCPVGASGDPHPYKNAGDEIGKQSSFGSGATRIEPEAWVEYQKKMFRFYYDTYKRTTPRIHTLFNTIYDRELHDWAMENLPGLWTKTNRIGDRYYYNGESREDSYLTWLPPQIRTFQKGKAVRARSEMDLTNQGWFKEAPVWNMYWTQLWGLHNGQDMHNQVSSDLQKKEYYAAFQFYSDYAGYKDPRDSHGAWCALHDGLDYADTKRFPEAAFGPLGEDGPSETRYRAILKAVAPFGAKQSEKGFGRSTNWRALDDIGYHIYRGNFELYLNQYDPGGTSKGLWRVGPLDQPYGRFARRFDHASGKDAMYFNIADGFFFDKPLAGAYEVKVRVVYFDSGSGRWSLQYDAVGNPKKTALSVRKTNTGRWKEAVITLRDANFGNRCPHGTDLMLVNGDAEDDTFHMIEVTRSTGDRKNFWGDE